MLAALQKMRILLYEHLCAGGAADPSLRAEGWAMLSALIEDFSRVPGVAVTTLLDDESRFRECARNADCTLVVAPEFDDLLASRSEWAREEGSFLLGSSPEAIRAASDKSNLERVLRSKGVRTPRVIDPSSDIRMSLPLICKPRFGAGCMDVRWIDSLDSLNIDPSMILQEAVDGTAASAAVLVWGDTILPLRAGYQDVRRDGGMLSYHGGRLPLPPEMEQRALTLATQAIACFTPASRRVDPGGSTELNGLNGESGDRGVGCAALHPPYTATAASRRVDPGGSTELNGLNGESPAGLNGFIGVDLVLGDAEDGSEDYVIEINPRVTTAYVGLRRLCVDNLAAYWLQMMRGEPVTKRWQPRSLSFAADGNIKE